MSEKPFLVLGHEATITSPSTASIAIMCPFPSVVDMAELRPENIEFIQTASKAVMKYLLLEGFITGEKGSAAVKVYMKTIK